MEKSEEIEKLGWRELISNPENLIFVEWPENIAEAMPENHIGVRFDFVDENIRKISFE